MTNWLKPRLIALFCGAVFLGGATYLRAQSDYPAPAKTPEEAASQFYKALFFIQRNGGISQIYDMQYGATNSATGDESSVTVTPSPLLKPIDGSISRTQFNAFGSSHTRLSQLFNTLAEQAQESQYEARVSGTDGTQTRVQVTPSNLKREVVVIQEDGGYRVDLKATFGEWNNLSGEKLDEEWFRYSGITSPALAQNPNFRRTQCQSMMKQQMLGILQYAQDYDERYPPARKWIDVLQPYVRSEEIFRCPSLSNLDKGNGYAYNVKLSQTSLMGIQSSALTLNIYETSNLKRNVFAPFTGRAYRHAQNGKEGMNIAFADGHVKWYSRGKSAGLTIAPETTTPGFMTISGTTR